MAVTDDLAKQKQMLVVQQRHTNEMIGKEKNLLRQQLADIERQLSGLHTQRSKVQADLSKLGG